METEQDINKSNEEVKNIEEQHEKVRKTGAVAAAVLSAFLNTAPVAAASYTPPTEPNETPELIVPKTGSEQPITGDIVLRPSMTDEQIDVVAKEAVAQYEMERDFNRVMQECTVIAKTTEGRMDFHATDGCQNDAVYHCMSWYKSEVVKGNGEQAVKTLQEKLTKANEILKNTEQQAENGYTAFDAASAAIIVGLLATVAGLIVQDAKAVKKEKEREEKKEADKE
jgi:hypothetical protein